MDHEHDTEHEPVSYGLYVISWLALVVLTAITVTDANGCEEVVEVQLP